MTALEGALPRASATRPHSAANSSSRGATPRHINSGGRTLANSAASALARVQLDALRVDAETPDVKSTASTQRRTPRSAGPRRQLPGQPPLDPSPFSLQMERAVDKLSTGADTASYEEVQRILTDIRKQYDEVHSEACKREQELLVIRRDINLAEVEKRGETDLLADASREELMRRIDVVTAEIDEALETKQVYEHIASRLTREHKLMQQKVKIMEDHLRRKTSEAERKKASSRRMHEEKVACINQLEAMEQDVEAERLACTSALEDLEATSKLKQDEVRHRENFERWRYDVAAEAAGEAFKATAGRFWKIYALEKLTGNCLQKITFEQLEQSQMVEDGFQKMREVTGLSDVMDIVHKFLHRDVEHQQLLVAVREAEAKLNGLLADETKAKKEDGAQLSLMLDSAPVEHPSRPRQLHVSVARQEEELACITQRQEDLERQLKQEGLLFESVRLWTQRIARSLSPLEKLSRVDCPGDLPDYFTDLENTVERFLDRTRLELPVSRLAKAAGQAGGRERAEQLQLLTDKDFLRANCRVPASLDTHGLADDPRRLRGTQRQGNAKEEEENWNEDFIAERERLKEDSLKRAGVKDPRERSVGQQQRSSVSPRSTQFDGTTRKNQAASLPCAPRSRRQSVVQPRAA
uniref:Uncharacterized protein n=1 Tax=Alexandrium monilatum TaxID=311494 RepID=A0A7S4R9N8_9DINO